MNVKQNENEQIILESDEKIQIVQKENKNQNAQKQL